MSRTADNAIDIHIGVAVSNGDAVVAGRDITLQDLDTNAALNVDTVGVGAVTWCYNMDVLDHQVIAVQENDVE